MLLVLKKDQSCMSRKQGIGKSKWYGLVNKLFMFFIILSSWLREKEKKKRKKRKKAKRESVCMCVCVCEWIVL